jgi:4-hydroxy-3-methylbut-2-enyl diphosphate reductase IspH
VGIQIVEDDMNLAALMLGDNTVHEIEKLEAPAPFVLAAHHLASGNVKSGRKRRHAMPDVIDATCPSAPGRLAFSA